MRSLPAIISGAGGGGEPSILLDNLVAWWDLDEEGGVRADSHGSYNLSDYNAVGYSAWQGGIAAQFNGTLQKLYRSDAALRLSAFSVAIWVQRPQVIAYYVFSSICSCLNSTGGWALKQERNGGIWLRVRNGNYTQRYDTSLIMPDDQPALLLVQNTGTFFNISVNNGAIRALNPGALYSKGTTSPFEVGSNGYYTGYEPIGVTGPTAYYSATLTTDQRAALYNGGVPQRYAEL